MLWGNTTWNNLTMRPAIWWGAHFQLPFLLCIKAWQIKIHQAACKSTYPEWLVLCLVLWNRLKLSLETRLNSWDQLLGRSQNPTGAFWAASTWLFFQRAAWAVVWRVKIELTHRPSETRAAVTKWDRCGRVRFPVVHFPVSCLQPAKEEEAQC